MKRISILNLKIISIFKTKKIKIGINNYEKKKNYSTQL